MGVAVNVTVVPEQTGLVEGETETLTGRFGFTTIVIVFDVAGLFWMHPVMEEVRTQVTTSPFSGM